MTEHAKLSASGAHRWTKCTASIELEKNFEDRSNVYAEEGTRLHDIASNLLSLDSDLNVINLDCDTEVILPYLEYVKKIGGSKNEIYVEKRVDYSFLDREAKEKAFGTADCILIDFENGVLHIVDLKTGVTPVKAYKNLQLLLYAIGAFSELCDSRISFIKLHIVQPKINNFDSWGCDADELMSVWVSFFKNAIDEVNVGGVFRPSADTCKYCKAKNSCTATFNIVKKNLTEIMTKEKLTDDDKKWVIENSATIKGFLIAIEDEVKERIVDGRGFEGYKLVQGRGTRRVTENGRVMLEELYGDLIYKKSLKGFAELEKELGKGSLNDFIEIAYASPVLAPIEDSREALTFKK